MMHSCLSGELVDLEPLSAEHVSDAYVNWFNDPEVTRYNSHGEQVMTRAMVEEYVARVANSETDAVFAMRAKDGAHVGNISLQKIGPKNNNAECAIILGDKQYWGRGIAGEASQLLLAWGFEELGLHRIYCGTSVKNEPMQKLAAQLGFIKEGVRKEAMRKRGEFVDIIEYGLLRKDFSS